MLLGKMMVIWKKHIASSDKEWDLRVDTMLVFNKDGVVYGEFDYE